MEKTAVWSAERKCFLWNRMKRFRCRKEWQKYFHQHGVLLCAVTEADTQLACVLAGGTGKRPHYCIFFVHPMKMGGWEKSVGKAMAQKGCARCKESIQHNPKLQAPMDFASNAACGVEGNRFAAAVRITLIMLLAAERRQ